MFTSSQVKKTTLLLKKQDIIENKPKLLGSIILVQTQHVACDIIKLVQPTDL